MSEGHIENSALPSGHASPPVGALADLRSASFSSSRGTILLVEDDEAIREVESLLLDTLGYTVIAAASGAEALEKFREAQAPIDILLTDIVMPEMKGTQLARILRGLEPGLNVVFMSGYTAGALAEDQASYFVQKPFTREMLAGKLREAMRGRTPALVPQ